MIEFYTLEIDVPRCSLSYGVSPCTAAIGVTGDDRCFNCAETCQDVANYNVQTVPLRFTSSNRQDLGIPVIESVNVQPQRIGIIDSIGTRERTSVSMTDARDIDTVFDYYSSQRAYYSYEEGTLWGKMFARIPVWTGFNASITTSYLYDKFEFSEKKYYIVESANQTDRGATFQLCDVIKVFDDEKAKFPRPCDGVLSAAMTMSATTITLSPSGVGSRLTFDGYAMYPFTGYATIGGKEIVSFTRSGDVMTITARGLFGTIAMAHEKDASVQTAHVAQSLTPYYLVLGILDTFIDDIYIDNDDWELNINFTNPYLYTGVIAEPTSIKQLLTEIAAEVGLIVYTDMVGRKLRLKHVSPITPSASLTDGIMKDVSVSQLNGSRVTANYVRYTRDSAVDKMDEEKNYKARVLTVSADPRDAIRNNSPVIKNLFSRWINFRPAAAAVSDSLIAINNIPPKKITCKVPLYYAPDYAEVVEVTTSKLVGATGKMQTIPAIVMQRSIQDGMCSLELMEYRYNTAPPSTGEVIVPLEHNSVDMGGSGTLRGIYDRYYSNPPPAGSVVRFIASQNVIYGSSLNSNAAIIVGLWPEIDDGVSIVIENLLILGAGGRGSSFGTLQPSRNGGTGLSTSVPITLKDCTVAGGGGGGMFAAVTLPGGGGLTTASGGDGAGRQISTTTVATTNQSGQTVSGVTGGSGGQMGQQGGGTASGSGGDPGLAITGISYVTLINTTVIGGTS